MPVASGLPEVLPLRHHRRTPLLARHGHRAQPLIEPATALASAREQTPSVLPAARDGRFAPGALEAGREFGDQIAEVQM
jgi:hypothetical protein